MSDVPEADLMWTFVDIHLSRIWTPFSRLICHFTSWPRLFRQTASHPAPWAFRYYPSHGFEESLKALPLLLETSFSSNFVRNDWFFRDTPRSRSGYRNQISGCDRESFSSNHAPSTTFGLGYEFRIKTQSELLILLLERHCVRLIVTMQEGQWHNSHSLDVHRKALCTSFTLA
jgi:hypothetical protein